MPHDGLIVPLAHWRRMHDHVARCWPEEACGLLGGPGNRAERLFLVENVRHSRTEYLLAPDEQVRAMLELEALGWDVNGIFHSHPAGPPVPSATDIAQAYYPDAVYLIWAPGPGGDWQARGFSIVSGRVREVALQTAA
jgi:proteasome lid subunit RPN8/RPN11